MMNRRHWKVKELPLRSRLLAGHTGPLRAPAVLHPTPPLSSSSVFVIAFLIDILLPSQKIKKKKATILWATQQSQPHLNLKIWEQRKEALNYNSKSIREVHTSMSHPKSRCVCVHCLVCLPHGKCVQISKTPLKKYILFTSPRVIFKILYWNHTHTKKNRTRIYCHTGSWDDTFPKKQIKRQKKFN